MPDEEVYEVDYDGETWTFKFVKLGRPRSNEELYSVVIEKDGTPMEPLENATIDDILEWAEEQGDEFYEEFISQVLGQAL